MRAVAFGGSGRLHNTNNLNRQLRVLRPGALRPRVQSRCMPRAHVSRHNECVQLVGNIASRRQDCEDKARDSDKMCLDELRDCRAGC